MKKLKTVLLFSLLIHPLFCFSQIQIINGDTMCLVPVGNIRKANIVYEDLKECREVKDTLQKGIDIAVGLIRAQQNLITIERAKFKIQDEIINEKDIIIEGKNDEIAILKKHRIVLTIGFTASLLFLVIK